MKTQETQTTGMETNFQRTLGVGAITLMVIAMAAPIAIVAGTVPLISSVTGNTGTPVYYLVAGIFLCLFSVGFTAMSKFVPNAGAFYSYIQAGLGRVLGMGSAVMALVSYAILYLSVLAYCGGLASNVISTFTGYRPNWWLMSLLAWGIIAFLGYRNVDLSSTVLTLLLGLEFLSILVLDFAIVFQGDADGLNATPFSLSNVMYGAPGLGLMFAFFGFIGFESTAVYRNEAKDPDKTIPRATYLAVGVISLLALFSSWCVIMGGGNDMLALSTNSPDTMVADLASVYVGRVLHDLIQVLLVTSLFACALCTHNVVSRYQYTLASVKVLPQTLATVHPKYSSPSVASIVSSALSLVMLVCVGAARLDPVTIYTWFSGGATLGIMILEFLTSVSVLVFFGRNRAVAKRLGKWKTTVAPAVASVGLGVVLAMVVANFQMLIGEAVPTLIMGLVPPVTFAIGCVLALVLKSRKPKLYTGLARLVEIPTA